MNRKTFAGCLAACVLFVCIPECSGLSLLAPPTNQVVSLDVQTGAVNWKTQLPFKADSLLDVCSGRVRVTSASGNSEPKRIAFLDQWTGQVQQVKDQDCAMPQGRRYTVTGHTDKHFKEGWKLKERKGIDGRLEFVDAAGAIRWVIERKGICSTVVASDDFLVVGSYEWKPARRPILSAYGQGEHVPTWVFDLNRTETPKGRYSNYLSAAIAGRSVFVYWVGLLFELDRRTGKERRRIDCGKLGLSGTAMNEPGILVPAASSLIIFHSQNILCLDEGFTKVWSYHPNLVGNLLPSPVIDGDRLYFFRGLDK